MIMEMETNKDKFKVFILVEKELNSAVNFKKLLK